MVDEATRERIVELAEGNALYAEQLASFAAEGGEGLPPTLEAVLAGRLGRLDAAERVVLQRAAVVGREFSLGAVAALADGEVAPELLSLSRAGFVHPAAAADPGDDGYTFHHVLLRDAAYGSLTKADRADLHERAAAWIDRDGPGDDAIAGYHLEQAVRYRRELGEEAEELAAVAGERLGEAGMRVWRLTTTVAAADRSSRAAPSTCSRRTRRRAELSWELSIARTSLRPGRGSRRKPWHEAAEEAVAATGCAALARASRSGDCTHISCGRGELTLAEAASGASRRRSPTLERHADERGLGRALLELGDMHLFACNMAEIDEAATRGSFALCGCRNARRGVRWPSRSRRCTTARPRSARR